MANTSNSFGPTFGAELAVAGLAGLPIVWGDDGQLTGMDELTPDQQQTLLGVIAAHNPTRSAAPQIISDRQFFQQLAVLGVITADEALAAVGPGAIPSALSAMVDALPEGEQFPARMLLTGATQFDRGHPLVGAFGTAFGWNDTQIDAFWTAAAAL